MAITRRQAAIAVTRAHLLRGAARIAADDAASVIQRAWRNLKGRIKSEPKSSGYSGSGKQNGGLLNSRKKKYGVKGKFAKKVRTIIRKEEVKDKPTGMYVRQHGNAVFPNGVEHTLYSLDASNIGYGITVPKVANALAVTFNGKADSGDLAGAGSNYGNSVKIEIQWIKVEYLLHNNTTYPMKIQMYVMSPKGDTNVDPIAAYEDLAVHKSVLQFAGGGAVTPVAANDLYKESHFDKSKTYNFKIHTFTLRPGQSVTKYVRGKNFSYLEREHIAASIVQNNWKGLTQRVGFKIYTDIQTSSTAGQVGYVQGAATDPQRLAVKERFTMCCISPNEDTQTEQDTVVYSNWIGTVANTFESSQYAMIAT